MPRQFTDTAAIRRQIATEEETCATTADSIRALADLGTLSDAEEQSWRSLTSVHDKARNRVSKLEELLRQAEGGRLTVEHCNDDHSEEGAGPEFMRRVGDPWQARSGADSADAIRSRALAVVECGDQAIDRGSAADTMPVSDDTRTSLEGLVRSSHVDFSDYVLAVSDPHYKTAFGAMLRNERDTWTPEEREAVRRVRDLRYAEETRASLAEGNTGAFMVPFYLDPTILLTNAGQENPFRQIARVVQISTSVWHGVSSAGSTAEWTAESQQVSDATPVLVQPTVTPVRGDAYIQVTMEQLQDSDIENQIPTLLRDAKDRLEAIAFATGTGATQPTGIVTALNLVTASRVQSVTTASYGAVDVFNVDNSLNARYRPNAAWAGHWAVWNATRQFSTTVAPQAGAFWANLGEDRPEQLIGHPIYESSAMTSSVTTSGADVLILGDWSNFVIVDRLGMTILTNPLVLGANGRPIGEVGVVAFFRTGSGVSNADGFRMLALK